jgi:uncharacterized protein (DUF433 family)
VRVDNAGIAEIIRCSCREVAVARPLINISKDVLGGTPVFYGTRVPVQNLIDHLIAGDTIETFFEDFPTVNREQVLMFLETAGRYMISQANENTD